LIRLRLQRRGRKKRPYYHVVVADQRSPRDGRVIERLGRFDNVSENKQLILDEERVIHWLRIGAQPSDTVRSILKNEGILYKMHLLRWGKSEEEIEEALLQWKENRASSAEEKQVSRKEKQKALLEAEDKEYRKQLEEKAAEAARQAKIEKAEAEQAKAKAEAEAAEAEKEKAEEEDAAEAETKAEEIETSPTEEKKAETAEETEAKEDTAEEVIEEAEPEESEKTAEAEPKEEDTAEKTVAEEAKDEEADVKSEPAAEEKEEVPSKVSTDMNANEAIDHIKNTPLEELKGFVTDDEDRVTVQRAWESKQAE
jgi:small subunit ribosomal protein S16